MKNLWILIIPILIVGAHSSCDKVENPIKPSAELDSTLFPGDWDQYAVPVFGQNTNTDRNVLLEDYTGHRCGNCPDAATVASNIESANPGRVFVASIHASPTGLDFFQQTANDCDDTVANPTGKYCTILYCDEGLEYGQTFGNGHGFIGNPNGNVSRKVFGGDPMFSLYNAWSSRTDQVLVENDLKINIQAISNYYPSTRGLFLHTEVEFLEDLTGTYNMVAYLIEEKVVDYQYNNVTDIADYEHHNVFRGCLDGEAWGRQITTETTTGTKAYLDYSYQLPTGKTNDDYHVLVYVYDQDTYEVMQVIKHEF